MSRFLDLIQTQSVYLPLFVVLLILAGFGVIAYLVIRRPDRNTLSLKRQEAERMEKQRRRLAEAGDEESILTHFVATDELLPKTRVENLSRGSDALDTPFFRHLLSEYQFKLETGPEGHVALRDTKYEGLNQNLVILDVNEMSNARCEDWLVKVRAARNNIRRRAQRQGIEVVYDRPGNPGKQLRGEYGEA